MLSKTGSNITMTVHAAGKFEWMMSRTQVRAPKFVILFPKHVIFIGCKIYILLKCSTEFPFSLWKT
jgi:hypothetical protein